MQRRVTAETLSDNALLERIVERDEDALSVLYERYSGVALAVAYRALEDRAQAEDVVQEAFLAVWRRGATFDVARGSVKAWLLTIVRNAAIDRKRGRCRHQHDEVSIEDHAYRLSGQDLWADVARQLDREQVRAALAQLPAAQRATIELAYFGGLTQAEIAAQTGEALGTIKSRARLGLRRLESALRATYLETETGEHD